MTYPTNDPNFRRDMQRETDSEGLTTATWVSIAFVVLLFAGVAVWAYYSGDSATVTAAKRPGVEQTTTPPATTGQGGAASKMPTAKDKDM